MAQTFSGLAAISRVTEAVGLFELCEVLTELQSTILL